jgi:hypothetical protein
VAPEKPEAELKRLLKEQHKARQDEVFGGFSPAERAEYEEKADRIHALESEIQPSAASKKSSAKAEQERQWNKEPETDTPQAEAHQSYRSREKGSTDSSSDSRKQGAKPKETAEEKGGE